MNHYPDKIIAQNVKQSVNLVPAAGISHPAVLTLLKQEIGQNTKFKICFTKDSFPRNFDVSGAGSMISNASVKKIDRIAFFIILLLGISFSLRAQQKEILSTVRQPSDFADTRPEYCWRTEQRLYDVFASTPLDETIIIIARLGARDSRPNLNQRRLYNAQTYVAQNADLKAKHPAEKIILAQGEPAKEFGQLEFYVRGQLIEIIKVSPNLDLDAGDCYAQTDGGAPCSGKTDKLFYPCKTNVRKRKQKTK